MIEVQQGTFWAWWLKKIVHFIDTEIVIDLLLVVF